MHRLTLSTNVVPTLWISEKDDKAREKTKIFLTLMTHGTKQSSISLRKKIRVVKETIRDKLLPAKCDEISRRV